MGETEVKKPKLHMMQPSSTNVECSQCGYYHPPIPAGKKCPLVTKVKSKGSDSEFDLKEFLITMKTVLESQIEMRDIKDLKKFSQNLIVHLTKYCEDYKE